MMGKAAILGKSVLWTAVRPDGATAHALLVRGESQVRLRWFLDGEVQGEEVFDAELEARDRAEELRLLVNFGGMR